MTDRYRSAAARDLMRAIRKSGGRIERCPRGRIVVTGPKGSATIQEPNGGELDRGRRNSSITKFIREKTGLEI